MTRLWTTTEMCQPVELLVERSLEEQSRYGSLKAYFTTIGHVAISLFRCRLLRQILLGKFVNVARIDLGPNASDLN